MTAHGALNMWCFVRDQFSQGSAPLAGAMVELQPPRSYKDCHIVMKYHRHASNLQRNEPFVFGTLISATICRFSGQALFNPEIEGGPFEV